VTPHERIFVALDTPDAGRARELARQLTGRVGGFKVGLEAFIALGPSIVDELRSAGHVVFLDLKLHDIPNTVAGAAASAARLGVSFLTVHALGGAAMIARAVEACAAHAPAGTPSPIVLAVTILTSHDDASLAVSASTVRAARRCRGWHAWRARPARADWSARRSRSARRARRTRRGARRAGDPPRVTGPRKPDDQARVATPGEAVKSGADRIVVGRPITGADDPQPRRRPSPRTSRLREGHVPRDGHFHGRAGPDVPVRRLHLVRPARRAVASLRS
jgi:orotidine-5'-phosphate decarboxylase